MNKMALLVAMAVASLAWAGDPYPPVGPGDAGSAMFTVKDVYDRLATGTNAPKRTGAFTETTAGPTTGTMPTLNQIMAAAPATNASGAVDGAVLSGQTYWGLTQGAWGTRTGTIATVTLSATTSTVVAGYYSATNLVQVDDDLAAGNIRTNVTIFGIVGTLRTNAGSAYPAVVPKSGRTTSYATGDDGDLGMGVAWPNPRFTVQADTNCVLDNLTGLIWARNANMFGLTNWGAAVTNCNNLDYGGQTDWRVPNAKELYSLIDLGWSYPAICSTAGTGKWTANDPFTNVRSGSDPYWSSTTDANNADNAWCVYLTYGEMYENNNKTVTLYVWPVRGGQ